MTEEQSNQLQFIYDRIEAVNITPSGISQVIYLGSARSFDIKPIVGEAFINDYNTSDFIIGWDCPVGSSNQAASGEEVGRRGHIKKLSEFVLSYDNTTGKITITNGQAQIWLTSKYGDQAWLHANLNCNAKVWLLCKTPDPVLPS